MQSKRARRQCAAVSKGKYVTPPAIDTSNASTINTAIQNFFGAVLVGGGLARAIQTIKSVLNYFTEDHWVKMQKAATMSQKIVVVGDRLSSIGIKNPSKASFKHVVALLACCSMPTAGANALHGLVADRKAYMQSTRPTCSSITHLRTYLNSPQELPSELYAGAYSTPAPITKDDMLASWRGIIVPFISHMGCAERERLRIRKQE